MAQCNKRECLQYKCDALFNDKLPAFEKKNKKAEAINLPEKGKGGIYAIFYSDKVIYVGMSTKDIRSRLLTHLNGSGDQEIDKYLKPLRKSEDLRKLKYISISYVEVKDPKCEEHDFIQCLANRQGNKLPEFNMISGNNKCSEEEEEEEEKDEKEEEEEKDEKEEKGGGGWWCVLS